MYLEGDAIEGEHAVLVHDCSRAGVQEVPYDEFEQSLAVNVPGMSRRNTYRVFGLPDTPVSERELAETGFVRKAHRMLSPPVALFGLPAMRKLAKEIAGWWDEACYRHLVAYAGQHFTKVRVG